MDKKTKNKNDGPESNFFMKNHPLIVFMGTTNFFRSILKKSSRASVSVIGVVTNSRKASRTQTKDRGESAVKKIHLNARPSLL
ncbi:MAG: hypothetical protein ACMUEL_01950 [Flavobacteriales bacterium Tduv]